MAAVAAAEVGGITFFKNTAYWWVEFNHILETDRVSLLTLFQGFFKLSTNLCSQPRFLS